MLLESRSVGSGGVETPRSWSACGSGHSLADVDLPDPALFTALETELEPLGVAVGIRVLRRLAVVQDTVVSCPAATPSITISKLTPGPLRNRTGSRAMTW